MLTVLASEKYASQSQHRIYDKLPLHGEASNRRNSYVTALVPDRVTLRLVILKKGPRSAPIQCKLVVAELHDRPYEALSYVWGDETDLKAIICNGESLLVRHNLFDALQNLRLRDVDRTIWIDAICIDQMNLQERGEQVSLMGRIYGAARRVLVWLGEPHVDDSEAFSTIITLAELIPERGSTLLSVSSRASLSNISRREIDSYHVVSHLRFRQLLIFFSRPWFERVWVIQEIVRAKQAVVICGTRSVLWEDFARVVLSFNEALSYLESQYPGESLDGVSALDNLPAMSLLKNHHEQMTLFSILCIASTFKSTDERDKLFALLNLGNRSSLRIQPDYTSHYFDVFRKHVVYELTRRHRLDYLARPPVQRRQDWPSWVPDWTEKSRSSYFYTAMNHNFHAALDTVPTLSVCGNTLTIKGKIVDHIAHLVAPMDQSRQVREGEHTDSDVINPHEIIKWLEECMTLVPLRLGLVRDAADSALNPFLRAFTCVGVNSIGKSTRQRRLSLPNWTTRSDTKEFRKTLEKLAVAIEDQLFHQRRNHERSLLDAVIELASKLYSAITDRQFLKTLVQRRLGWVSKRAQPGDAVCVLYGGAVPFVLRAAGSGTWKIVGECYLEGFMEGQAIKMTELPDYEFRII